MTALRQRRRLRSSASITICNGYKPPPAGRMSIHLSSRAGWPHLRPLPAVEPRKARRVPAVAGYNLCSRGIRFAPAHVGSQATVRGKPVLLPCHIVLNSLSNLDTALVHGWTSMLRKSSAPVQVALSYAFPLVSAHVLSVDILASISSILLPLPSHIDPAIHC